VVIKHVSNLTGKNFIIDNNVRGTVTVICPTKFPAGDSLKVFESILDIRGYAMVPDGEFTKIVTKREGVRSGIDVETSGKSTERSPEKTLVTQIIPLYYADVSQMRNALGQLFSKDASVIPYHAANTLIITDTASRIDRLMEIIKELDRPGPGMDIRNLIKSFSTLTGKNFIVSNAVAGMVTLFIPTKIPEDRYLESLEAILEAYGFKMEPAGEFIKIDRDYTKDPAPDFQKKGKLPRRREGKTDSPSPSKKEINPPATGREQG